MAALETVLGTFPPAGVVVFVPAYGLWRHKGIVSDRWYRGKPMILCNSPIHGVIEQPWDEFFGGEPLRHEGYPGSLPVHEVLRRARSRLGEPYVLFVFNCDHYKNYVHGLPVESEQLRATLAILGSVGVVAAAFARG
jgi:hypothetical protein